MSSALQGNLHQFAIAEIFQLLAASRKSGTLGIQRADAIVMVYFRQGEIIYGYGPRLTYHLGQMLCERGLLSREQLDTAVQIQARTENSHRLGEILIEHGFVSRAALEETVRSQVEDLLYSLLAWEMGTFKFYEDQFPTQEEITVRISVENIILEGLRRMDEAELITRVLPDTSVRLELAASTPERQRDMSLAGTEWNVLSLVSPHRTIEQICSQSPFDRTTTLRSLARLKLAGIVAESSDTSPTQETNLGEMLNRLAGLFEAYLEQKSPRNRLQERISVLDDARFHR